jgi:DNA primase small subunit
MKEILGPKHNQSDIVFALSTQVNLGTDKNNRVEIYSPLHPALSRAYTVLEPMFIQDIIPYNGHGILATEESWTELLDTLPSQASSVKDALLKKWKRDASSPGEKWVELKRYLDVLIGKSESEKKSKLAKSMTAAEKTQVELWPIATVFKYTYPRLDINVSKMQNHLLKSPFCVHPKTGRVCVPIDIHKVDEFNPFEVPTLPQLIEELDGYEAQQQDDAVEHDWQKTSLKECYERFQRNFLVPMWRNLRRAERDQQERQAALMGDF